MKLNAIAFVLGFAACVLGHQAVLRSWGPAERGDSNYFSTLARLQIAQKQEGVQVTLVGSSITGRLGSGRIQGIEVQNLGCDGGNAYSSLGLLDMEAGKSGEVIVVEVNTILAGIWGDDTASKMARSSALKLGQMSPLLMANARPVSLLYDRLNRKSGAPSAAGEVPALWRKTDLHGYPLRAKEPELGSLPNAEQQRLIDCAKKIREFRKHGKKFVLVTYPAGPISEEVRKARHLAGQYLAEASQTPWVDLDTLIPAEKLQYSDRVHLGKSSAVQLTDDLVRDIVPMAK